VRQAEERLAEIFGVSKPAADSHVVEGSGDGRQWEAGAAGNGLSFAVTWKRSGSPGHVATAIRQLEAFKGRFGYGVIPVLAVPYMGERAQALCAQAELCWLDLSGNARVVAPGVFYQNLDNRNRFRRAGRPESAFGAKGARITRRLLMEPDRPVRQRRLALSTGLNEGHTSRVVGKLVEAGLVERVKEGVRVVDAKALLAAWQDDYRFDRHHVVRGHVASRGGEALIRAVAEGLSRHGALYAATALSAARLWTGYAEFRLATVYVSTLPPAGLKEALGLREEDRGANVWLVVPNDEGVFDGAEFVEGIRCVHPVQAYVDLKGHPERTAEADEALRRRLFVRGGTARREWRGVRSEGTSGD
ncbi:MAG: type IV toxin-antitoxin system AbiEi family antitoxin, partial [Gemmatimonadota bacterium]|nr:type IV toxin-antitoxin system AbiEi family antitoxin [Gemmatimonadota bacterium]